ncbi:type I-U CRISPR-associated protein Cas5/Cas6 [Bifidobacterium primatium]|uniref:Type I-U CRISPR-associated protein Cas5/Cas6 n=1 Tax=Bifidobacterium primatium TaxID=2045438 RepID=A0A2M9H7A3_9BIFI|nr:type I-U CRISPR-associated protein Csb2 [Bifidobacterium primatium]PJM72676.1 type I-U CRISPR-associated protein Cas5/Cas6 [Bifidobacterium primatium]
MPFAISAGFLMHTYQGADDTGSAECYPSPERLYRALVSVAYGVFGFHSDYGQRESGITDAQLESVFHWLESNPPDWIRLPMHMRDNRRSSVIVYRNRGSYSRKKVKSANAMSSVAYGDTEEDSLLWQWEQEPDHETADLLARMCWEIPYLGEACTPVRVTAAVIDAGSFPIDEEHSLQISDDDLSFGGMSSMLEFPMPWEGHLQELQKGHASVYPRKPSAIRGNGGEEEKQALPNTLISCVRHIGYIRPTANDEYESLHPWTQGFFIPARVIADKGSTRSVSDRYEEWEPKESTLVAWAVAMHRMLIREWGYGASPMLTGKYGNIDAVERPANNVAIQILTSDMPVSPELNLELPGFLLMIPRDMPVEEIGMLANVCDRMQGRKLFYSRHSQTLELGFADTTVDLDRLWQPVEQGHTRLWVPYPLCMRETRNIPDPTGTRKWGARESIALAVAHIWRDYLNQSVDDGEYENPDREMQYWRQSDWCLDESSPVGIHDAHTVIRTHMSDYVHKTQPGNLLVGLSALLSFDTQCGLDRTALAIGQSRHLGGGLLVPMDVPKQLLDDTGKPKWIR